MVQLSDEFDDFDPSADLPHLCPILDGADNVEDTAAKIAYTHLQASQHILLNVVNSLEDSSINPKGTRDRAVAESQKHLHHSKDYLDTSQAVTRAELNTTNTNSDSPIETHLTEALTRTETAITDLHKASSTNIIKQTHDKVVSSQTHTERALTQLTALLDHEAYVDCEPSISWKSLEDATQTGEGISIDGHCLICGKEFEQVFDFSGVWDEDAGEHGEYAFHP